ncbi:MAG: flavodoxin family protein [Peptoniphilaceae bacterium]
MIYKVCYFTRTENSKRIAEKIANKLSCQLIEVKDNMDWSGVSGFAKGGLYASRDKDVEISLSQDLGSYDELIIVSPLWAAKVAPAIRMLLKEVPKEKVHLVISAKSTRLMNKEGYKSILEILGKNNNEDELIDDFVKRLGKEEIE